MRRFILAAGTAALFLAAPALAAVRPAPSPTGRTDPEAPADWIRGLMMDRFTVPLGRAQPDSLLLGTGAAGVIARQEVAPNTQDAHPCDTP